MAQRLWDAQVAKNKLIMRDSLPRFVFYSIYTILLPLQQDSFVDHENKNIPNS
jgi:hypothetical protein